MRDLNTFYRGAPSLYEQEFSANGFEWIDCNDVENSVISFFRKGKSEGDYTLMLCNFTPIPRHGYRIGLPIPGKWVEALNSDAKLYGGSGQGNLGAVETRPVPYHGSLHSASFIIPPLGIVAFRPE
jgi:1,4-alpha-glucan branching enzyme